MAHFSVPYLKLRDGRPRWEPGPGVRRLGFRGADLKDPNGAWLDETAAIARARELNAQVAARRSGGMTPRRIPKADPHRCAALWHLYRQSPEWDHLAASTRRDYESKAGIWLAEFGTSNVAAIRKEHLRDYWEELYRTRGHHMANGVIAVAKLLLSYAEMKGWIALNPALRLKIKGTTPRTSMWTPEETLHLVNTADARGDVAVADAFVLALHTGQRRGDVLSLLLPHARPDGWADFKQGKTGARVSVPFTPALAERIEAIRRRHNTRPVVELGSHVVLDAEGRPYTADTFSAAWREIRRLAAITMRSIASRTFGDLRDTAVTRLALAGCTVMQIRAITGHSLETIHQIMKHYLVLDSRMARAAIDKLNAWMAAEGIAI